MYLWGSQDLLLLSHLFAIALLFGWFAAPFPAVFPHVGLDG